MKKLLLLTVVSCFFAAQSVPVLADATTAQKEQIARAREQVRQAIKTDEGCRAICEEIMRSKKARKVMADMMKSDPETMKMMKK